MELVKRGLSSSFFFLKALIRNNKKNNKKNNKELIRNKTITIKQ
jgi:hypothetical protein